MADITAAYEKAAAASSASASSSSSSSSTFASAAAQLADVHDATGVFKAFFRKLAPDPLVPCADYEKWLALAAQIKQTAAAGGAGGTPSALVEQLRALVQALPQSNYEVLLFLCWTMHNTALRQVRPTSPLGGTCAMSCSAHVLSALF